MTLTFDEVASALTSAEYVYAKTMPQCPHHYTLRKKWNQPVEFETLVAFMREHGYRERFGRSMFTRLDVNDQKYWTMGAPLPATILINRAKIDRREPYDVVAPLYDGMWSSLAVDKENRDIIGSLNYQGGDILDIGCGTGMLLEYLKPDGYLGIDPSGAMLARLHAKFPGADTLKTTFESFFTTQKFDLAVGLFASPSYVKPLAWQRLPKMMRPGGRWFLMFYAPDYSPITHAKANLDLEWFDHGACHLPGQWTRRGNYMVLEGSP